MNVVANSLSYSKMERTRRMPKSSVRASQTRLSSSTPSFVCKESRKRHVISIFVGRWKGELLFLFALFLQQLLNGLVIGIFKGWRKISKILSSSTVALEAVFCVDDFRDAIQAYRRRVDDLKMDFVVIFPLPDFSCRISRSAVDPFSG